MNTHTPGPWTVEREWPTPNSAWIVFAGADDEVFCEKLSEGNARLIASSPDLLDLVLEWVDAPEHDALDMAHQIIPILKSLYPSELSDVYDNDIYKVRDRIRGKA